MTKSEHLEQLKRQLRDLQLQIQKLSRVELQEALRLDHEITRVTREIRRLEKESFDTTLDP